MTEDERLKQALEAELEDSYQEYLTLALKGETQDLMQTSTKFQKNMEKLMRDAERTASSDAPQKSVEESTASEQAVSPAASDSRVVYITPTRNKNKFRTLVKVASIVSAVACVAIICFAVALSQMDGLTKNGDQSAENAPRDVAFIEPTAIYAASEVPREQEAYLQSKEDTVAMEETPSRNIETAPLTEAVPQRSLEVALASEEGVVDERNGDPPNAASPGVVTWKKADSVIRSNSSTAYIQYTIEPIVLSMSSEGGYEFISSKDGKKEVTSVPQSGTFRLALILPEVDQKQPTQIIGMSINGSAVNHITVSTEVVGDKTQIILNCLPKTSKESEDIKAEKAELWVLYDDQVYLLEYDLTDT